MKSTGDRPKTTSLAGAAVFGALAAVMTVLIQVPYPVPGLQFLRFDAAEIVDALAFLVFGPLVGFLTALVHWIVLNFLPTAVPIYGPLLKFFAVTSTFVGMLLGYALYSRLLQRRGGTTVGFGLITGVGLLSRVLIMTVVNYFFLIFVFSPDSTLTPEYVAAYLTGLGIFNAIHSLVSVAIPVLVVGAVSRMAPHIVQRMWISGIRLFRNTTGTKADPHVR